MGESRSITTQGAEQNGAGQLPEGWLAYDRLHTRTDGTTGEMALLEVEVDVRADRALRVLWQGMVGADGSGTRARLRIREDGTMLQSRERTCPSTGEPEEATVLVHVTPTAGTHRYTVTIERASGSGAVHADADPSLPAELIVEDVGPAPS